MTTSAASLGVRPPRGAHGFSLVEVVVSLAVLAVATFILTSLFFASNRLDKQARFETIAIHVADAALAKLTASPDAFVWPSRDELAGLEPAPVRGGAGGEQTSFGVTAPAEALAYPPDEGSYYDSFAWNAYAAQPADSDSFLWVVVRVEWEREGVSYARAQTGVMPRSLLEERP